MGPDRDSRRRGWLGFGHPGVGYVQADVIDMDRNSDPAISIFIITLYPIFDRWVLARSVPIVRPNAPAAKTHVFVSSCHICKQNTRATDLLSTGQIVSTRFIGMSDIPLIRCSICPTLLNFAYTVELLLTLGWNFCDQQVVTINIWYHIVSDNHAMICSGCRNRSEFITAHESITLLCWHALRIKGFFCTA